MDKLRQYKKIWQKQENKDKQLSSDTLTKMIHRRSSSIVKWIFYISIIEFTVVLLVNIFGNSDWEQLKELGLYHFLIGISILGYIIMAFFIFLFYKKYKEISVTDSTKELIKSILNTRKVVKHYILINLIIITFSLLYGSYVILQSPQFADTLSTYGTGNHIILWVILVLFILFIVGIILLVYLLLYGFLVKRLYSNYKELTKP